MKCTNFTFKGKEDLDIYTYKWEDESIENPKAIVQIAHGMAETAQRYEVFAKELTKNGYIVYINDHRGHGKTAKTVENVGHLAEKEGFRCLVEDMNTLTSIIKKENKDLPIYLFGHSMGSFASQRYIMDYSDNLSGLILCGSNGKQGIILNFAHLIINHEIKKYGRNSRSNKINDLIFGGESIRRNKNTKFDWLSRDKEQVEKYINDPFCGVVCTCGFFYDLVQGLKEIEDKENLKKIPLDIPIYIISGDKDPIGKNGKGVLRLRDRYIKLGVKDVTCKLYKDGRHELLNEINKEEVFEDVICWLNEKWEFCSQ
ncbi:MULTISPECIES: alpha/beta hydrolase [unclassified Clostridioides]|uniref:alpha/beta hydrolase n=1 Tax=unclassified Clostridioides TaxID=2635829 RepID=UPI001D0CA420|nr:alpha/beta hydrolase [Clostridioides sp. ES-S-0001-02]MCC0640140.1 alpha/beta hydrolase [Clostridioides sp. ES-S-0049-03]MCC0652080.1 alpha/beta hydrolase [Clostridioides sp. ES-S-0001-03]MCC0673263.1 alpha/beta hydrolase [Clostridioides sp. ES-S-0145-01]MCC0674638.1 alpha/beta hydrolase [Clostridioides sp. ES-W-0018-02]MCC0694459.1 alpha/beta hydrolase [Clostridioides sp. ES-S-0048-02]MCC0702681.1 alpha/beta hydrolase [Clostridioides sp. ES-S-0049-02]MCC0710547.1 alpha/beta hydrolase [Cl